MQNPRSTGTQEDGKETRHFLKGIKAKLISAVLVAVILPFFGLVFFIETQIDTRLKENIVRQSLLGIAGNLAAKIDKKIKDCNADMQLLASGILGYAAIDEHIREGRENKGERVWRQSQSDLFNRYIQLREVYDLILLVGTDGRLVTGSTKLPNGRLLKRETLESLEDWDFSNEIWFKRALLGKEFRVDKHKSQYLVREAEPDAPLEALYHIGFAVPVQSGSFQGQISGVLFSIVNWKHIQAILDVPDIKSYFNGLVKDKEPSPYAWMWGSDGNTILAHKNRRLYGLKVNGPQINLPQMVEDALSGISGYYREYEYLGVEKNASFHHCKGPEAGALEGGFGWIVGVGIDNNDIYAMSSELTLLLYESTAIITLLVVLWAMVVARRTTKPILALQKHMRKVSKGNLEAHIHIDTGDEISDLAEDLNHMLLELKEKREQLIKAEKNAAWREMARQISHDIKNTLTPIKLSIDLLKQSAKDHSPNYQEILQQTLKMIDNQIANLEEIAIDFYEFTGGRISELKECDLGLAMAEVLKLNRTWAKELGITIKGEEELTAPDREKVIVMVDHMKFHRTLTNLVSNAFQAMPDGGQMQVHIYKENKCGVLEIIDSGVGIPNDVRQHLYEPYFTTRSKGTGLGLAIAKKVVEECGGSISLKPNPNEQKGTIAVIRMPLSHGDETQ